MEDVYNQILTKTKTLVEMVTSCKNKSEQALRLSYKLLSIMDLLKSQSKRLEGSIVEEIKVLDIKIKIFLSDSKNEKIFSDIQEISSRIIEEASSY